MANNNEIIRSRMNRVLDDLVIISRCKCCGCVKGTKPNGFAFSNYCNYNVKPSYLNFNDPDTFMFITERSDYCSYSCFVKADKEGDYWASKYPHCGRKIKDFGNYESTSSYYLDYMR